MTNEEPRKLHLVLGVTGSVATIKIPELVEKLLLVGFDVRIVTTQNGLRFFSSSSVSVPIYSDKDEWSTWRERGDPILHIEVSLILFTVNPLFSFQLRNWADIFLLAPLSANTLAKVALGLADNLVTTLARSWWFPIRDNQTVPKAAFFAPAMNTLMWDHPFTVEHVKKLTENLGWKCIHPISKKLMCGEEGIGAMAELNEIVQTLVETRALILQTVSQ